MIYDTTYCLSKCDTKCVVSIQAASSRCNYFSFVMNVNVSTAILNRKRRRLIITCQSFSFVESLVWSRCVRCCKEFNLTTRYLGLE
jgi:hypothetical protein